MPFTNPASLTLLQDGIDYFAWPCISGERFAPTLSGSAYSELAGYPALSFVATLSPQADWPYLPRVGYSQDAIGTVTMTSSLYVQNPLSGSEVFRIGLASTARLTYDATGLRMSTGAGDSSPVALSSSSWHKLTMTITSSGANSWTLDGAAQPAPTAGTTLANTTLRVTATSNATTAGHNVYVSGVRVAWS